MTAATFMFQYYYVFVVGGTSWVFLNASMMPENMANVVDPTRLVKVIVLFVWLLVFLHC